MALDRPLRLRAITCDILARPVYYCAATTGNVVDVQHLSAACGGATSGVVARDVPVVLARAHDCITIFLGGRARYEREFETTPGTYCSSPVSAWR